MDDLFEDMFDTAGALNSVDTLTGKNLSELVRALKRIEQQIEDAELHTKSLKSEKHKLSVELIPALMDEMGVERLTSIWLRCVTPVGGNHRSYGVNGWCATSLLSGGRLCDYV